MMLSLSTERLMLEVLHENRAPEALDFYIRNKEFFEQWEPLRPDLFYTLNYHKSSMTYEYQQTIKGKELRYWIFLKNRPDTIIGTVCFHNIMRGSYQSCIIGYKIDRFYLRQGFAYEALSAAIQSIFSSYGIHRIEAYIHPQNLASIALINKLHFLHEGTAYKAIQLQGLWTDHYRYALVNEMGLYQ